MAKHITDFFNLSTAKFQAIHGNKRKNFLSFAQCDELNRRGLFDARLRDNERIGVEDLFCMLPACITKTNDCAGATLYVLYVYKSAWDVPVIAYKNPREYNDVLFSSCADDTATDDKTYCGSMVDALYNAIIWLDDNYPMYLEKFKWTLKYQLDVYCIEPMNDWHYIRFSFKNNNDNTKYIGTLSINNYDDWEDLMNRECDDECVEYIKNVFNGDKISDIKFIELFNGDNSVMIGAHQIKTKTN